MASPSHRQNTSPRFAAKRKQIVDSATSLLNDNGFAGMTLEDVAQGLGQTTPSILYYFRRKEQLAAAVFEESLEQFDAMVEQAGREEAPKARVQSLMTLLFDHHAEALAGKRRPLAMLSEMRALEETTKNSLLAHYQHIFRNVRAFFGPFDDEHRKLVLTARTHLLNESLFWLPVWLPRHAISDFADTRRRMFTILENGISASPAFWPPVFQDALSPSGDVRGASAYIRAATRLINEIGYRGASIDRIAAELNLTKGSFYHHLEAKDDLVLECCKTSYRRLGEFGREFQDSGLDPREQITCAMARALTAQFAGEFPLLRSTALQAMPKTLRAQGVAMFERAALRIAGLLVDGMSSGTIRIQDPAIASEFVMSAINSAYDLRNWARRQPLDQAITIYGSHILNGIFD